MPFKPPKTEKCILCTKSVYAQERQEAGGNVYHKLCFKCNICNMLLNLQNYKQAESVLYCKKHFQSEVIAKNTQDESVAMG